MSKKILIYYLALTAFSICFAESQSNDLLTAKIYLNNGKEIVCNVLNIDKNEIKIQRKVFGGAIANEFYKFDKIKKIDLSKPAILTNNLKLTTGSVRKTKAKAKETYNLYKPFAKFHGKTWSAETAWLYAKLLETSKNYSSALKIYNRLAKNKFHQEFKNKTLLHRAVCLYKLGSVSNALPLFTQAYELAETSDQHAEINFYLGKIYAQLGDYKKSLFTLLKNEVFYSMRDDWEVKSLDAALFSYAKLDREKEFVNTCSRITNKFSDTNYSQKAGMYLKEIDKGKTLHELIQDNHEDFNHE